MLVGDKVCDLTEDLLWFVCGKFDVFPNRVRFTCLVSLGVRFQDQGFEQILD